MTPEGIIKELRRAERHCLNDYSTMAKQAADLIESQNSAIDIAGEIMECRAQKIESQSSEIKRLTDENTALRNELCLKCGQYRQAHKGACNGCRWERKEYDCKRIV